MKVILILIVFLVLAGWDVPELWTKKRKKDLFVYSGLMAFGLILSVLAAYHVHIPNPAKGLEALFKPLGSLLKE